MNNRKLKGTKRRPTVILLLNPADSVLIPVLTSALLACCQLRGAVEDWFY